MTNQEILRIAMAQSAIDLCAESADFDALNSLGEYRVIALRDDQSIVVKD